MSRVIKFRAWDKEDSRMIVHEQELIPLKVCSLGVLRLDPHYANNLWEIIPIDRFHMMQFTGLPDKNHKEIYEGDIYHMGDPNIKYVVEWSDCGLRGKQLRSSSYAGIDFWQKNIEVIGNIYENPDLLTRLASDAATI